MDKSVSKFTRKFAIKFIIWFLLLAIISTIGVVIVFTLYAGENIDTDDTMEVLNFFNGLMISLIVVDLVVAFLATKMSIKNTLKKVEVTAENKGIMIRNAIIALVIFSILVCGLHSNIRMTIFELSDSDFDIEEFEEEIREEGGIIATEEEIEEEIEEYDLSEEEADIVRESWKIWKRTKYYVFDGLFLLLMIPVVKKAIEKKVA